MNTAFSARFLYTLLYFGLAMGSLLLSWNGFIFPLAGAHDGLRYLQMMESLSQGAWLGEYHYLSLIRLPLYPAFLSIAQHFDISVVVWQKSVYVLSVSVLTVAIWQFIPQHKVSLFFYALMLYHPIALYPHFFIVPESAYLSLFCLLLAAYGFLNTAVLRGHFKTTVISMIFLSISLGLFWHMRGASVWLLIFLLFSLLLFWQKNLKGQTHRRWAILFLLPILSIISVGEWIKSHNHAAYGIHVRYELEDPALKQAFKQLTRLAPESHHKHVPISQQGFQTAYALSPTFATLKPHLTVILPTWQGFSCGWMQVCDELAGGWTGWAVRDAMQRAGYYADAQTAQRFYQTVADELTQACLAQPTQCSNNTTGNILAAPLQWDDAPRLLHSLWRIIWMVIDFNRLETLYQTTQHTPAPLEIQTYYADMTQTQFRSSANSPLVSQFVSPILSTARIINAALIAFILLMGIIALLQYRHAPYFHWIRYPLLALLILLASRLALIAYVDAMSFFAQWRYLIVLYPVLILMAALLLPLLFKAFSKHEK